MGRLIPAGTGMDYYRGIKIQGEDVEEETMVEDTSIEPASPVTTRTPEFSTRAAFPKARRTNSSASNSLQAIPRRPGSKDPGLFLCVPSMFDSPGVKAPLTT